MPTANRRVNMILSADAKELIDALNRSSTSVDKFSDRVESMSATQQRSGKVSSNFRRELDELRRAFGLHVDLNQVISTMGRFIASSSEAGAAAERLGRGTDNLGEQFGLTGDQIVSAIQKASGNTISQMDAMQIANQQMLFGVAKSEEEFTKLTRIAVILGQAMGQDATKSVQDLTVALGRQSPLILDNLGINLKLSEAYERYAETVNKTASELDDAEKKQAFMQEALKAGEEAVQALGEVQDDTATKLERIKAATSDFTVAFGQLANTIGESSGVFDRVAIEIDRMAKGAESWKFVIEEALPAIKAGNIQLADYGAKSLIAAEGQDQIVQSLEIAKTNFVSFRQALLENTGSYDEYVQAVDKAAEGNSFLANRLRLTESGYNELVKPIREARSATHELNEAQRLQAVGEQAITKVQSELNAVVQQATDSTWNYVEALRATEDRWQGLADLAPDVLAAFPGGEGFFEPPAAGAFEPVVGEQAALFEGDTEQQRRIELAEQIAKINEDMVKGAEEAAKAMSASFKSGIDNLSNLISNELQPTLQEVFDIGQIEGDTGNIDEGARRLAAIYTGALQGGLDENIPLVLEQIKDIDMLQPLEEALLSGDTTRIAEAAKSVLTDPILNSLLLDTELIKERVRQQMIENKVREGIIETIRQELLAEGMGEEEGGDMSGLFGQIIGIDDTGIEGVKSALGTVGETSAETTEGMVDNFDTLGTSIDTVANENVPNLETTGKIAFDNIAIKAQNAGDTIETEFETATKVANEKLKPALESIVIILNEIKEAADAAVDALSGLSVGGTSVTGKQHGGHVSVNTPFLVGEAGPELFVPKSSGTIIPNNRLTEVADNIIQITQTRTSGLESEERGRDQQTTGNLFPGIDITPDTKLSEVADNITQIIETETTGFGGSQVVKSIDKLISRQGGGPVGAGQSFLVGETGPELFIPSAAGLMSNQQTTTSQTSSLTIQNLTITGVNDPQQLFEAIEREARARGRHIPVVA